MNNEQSRSVRAIILCALQFESNALVAAGVDEFAHITCTGPGYYAVVKALESLDADGVVRVQQPILLVGVAGALSPKCPAGSAWVAGHVVSEQGESWATTWPDTTHPGAIGLEMKRILGADAIIGDPASRHEACHEYNADLVDLESHALASWACDRGCAWGVIRGVSDGCESALPSNIENWTRDDGRPNLLRIAADVVTHPKQIAAIRRLARDSAAAMRNVIGWLNRLGITESAEEEHASA